MAKPAANFSFTTNGLSVQFTDRSSGNPTSWAWTFGTNGPANSNVQNPAVTFNAAGIYTINLTATNTDGSNSLSFDLVVSSTITTGSTIADMVEFDLPGVTTVNSIGFAQLVKKYQLLFQSAAQIPDADVFNEVKWPSLWNALLAKLVSYDLVLQGIPLTPGSSTSGSTGGSGGVTGKGPLKSLETGPSKAAWYDPSTYWSNLFKSTAGGSGSVMAAIQLQACMFGGILKVKVPGCAAPLVSKPFIIAKFGCDPCYMGWPASKGPFPFWEIPSCTSERFLFF